MTCPNCGKKLSPDSRFCVYCGTPIPDHPDTEKQPASPISDQTPNTDVSSEQIRAATAEAKQAWKSTAAASAKAAGAAVQTLKKNPNKKRLVIAGVALVVALVAIFSVVKITTSPQAQLNRAIKAGELDEAFSIYASSFLGEDLSDKTQDLLIEAAKEAGDAFSKGDISYDLLMEKLGVISQFPGDKIDSTINSVRSSAEKQYSLQSTLDKAKASMDSGNYAEAITFYESVLKMDSQNETAKEGLAAAKSAGEKAVLEQANQAADGGAWDEALSILDEYQTTHGSSNAIQKAYEEIEKRRPISLLNITMVSSDGVDIVKEVVKDRWDNIYDGVVQYDASNDAYAYYSLNKAYSKFTGTIFVSPKATNEKDMSIIIYKDDKIAYQLSNITENTAPAKFEIDISGASTLRIVTANDGSYSSGILCIGNSNFQKSE